MMTTETQKQPWTLSIKPVNGEFWLIGVHNADGYTFQRSHARTLRGAKMCLTRYAKIDGLTKAADGMTAA